MQTLLFEKPSDNDLSIAAKLIAEGKLVIFPTETVYGLGANALDGNAVNSVFKAKGRPNDNPLIVHLAKPTDAEKYAYTNPLFYKLADKFMPGPLTVILPKKAVIPDEVTCGMDTVGLRVPSNPIAHRLIELSDRPIAAPSANLSGKPSPTTFAHCVEDMNSRVDAILGGGSCEIGVESTVIRLTDNGIEILRPGKVTYDDLKSVSDNVIINHAVKENLNKGEKAVSPGMKYRHYAPKSPVVLLKGKSSDVISFLIKKQQTENCGILCFDGDAPYLKNKNLLTFGKESDSDSQARLLFDRLRAFDSINVDIIYGRLPDDNGVGLAVYNRLIRAAGFTIKEV